MKVLLLLWLSLSLAASLQAQGDFHVVSGAEKLIEGGLKENLSVVSGNVEYTLRVPPQWTYSVDEPGHKVIFKSPDASSALTVMFTKNSPGELPDEDALRAAALSGLSGAAIYWPPQGHLQMAICPTSYKPGVYFDVVMVTAPHIVQRFRHAFVAGPEGCVEFILSSPDKAFDKSKPILMDIAGTFHLQVIKQTH